QRRAIRAPFSGEIGLIDVGIGDYVTPTTPVANLDERNTLLIEFRLPERFANQVRLGQQIDLNTTALPGVELVGSVSGIDSRVDTVSRTLLVQGTLNNEADLARPGMSFDVNLAFEGKELPAVPALAIQWDRNGSYVWKVESGHTVRSGVSIVGRQSDRVLIDGDLEVGDNVVTEGTASVRQGMAYRLPSEAVAASDSARPSAAVLP
ncbi:MAG: efflux RND transporter periplasmic adaptor subunit, partial [Phycisphaerales bacterium]|nr:efflux RND transporter periplasmic adaptor subunit [Phycisphaerales bacterium]